MSVNRYPIGRQDFRTLRNDDLLYVDKTRQVIRVIGGGKYLFLSRPRRFGKSLTVATIAELFSGDRDLFRGLYAEQHWDFAAEKRKVIWIRMALANYQDHGLERGLFYHLRDIAEELEIPLTTSTAKDAFLELIRRAGAEKPVAVLIDEYDKPLIDYLGEDEKFEEHRQIFKSFYSVLKDSDRFLKLVFITGVSAFSKVSIFSDLNNIKNISLGSEAGDLVGISTEELEEYFSEELKTIDRDRLREWYNGYSWDGEQRIYNPWSLLNFMDQREYHNFWFATGKPTFMTRELKRRGIFRIAANAEGSRAELLDFEAFQMNYHVLLFQTGYLTVREYDSLFNVYTLDYPNREVRQSLDVLLLNTYLDVNERDGQIRVRNLHRALHKGDVAEVISIINATFAEIPYDHWQEENEHFFHALIFLMFRLLGVYIRTEIHTHKGRCDALVETPDILYFFEFKLDQSAQAALDQIAERGYASGTVDAPQRRLAVGVNISKADKQIDEWEVVEVTA